MCQNNAGYTAKGQVFKHQDTTKQILMEFYDGEGRRYHPDPYHKMQAKVANASGLIGTYPATVAGSKIQVQTKDLTELVPDDYTLEIWETYTDDSGNTQTTIYPTPGYRVSFTVETNIADKTGQLIKQIGVQEVVNQAVLQAGQNLVIANTVTGEPGSKASVTQEYSDGKNKLTFTIPQGEQGPRGFQGPAGKSFQIKKTFTSIADMNASKGEGFEDGDFTLISSTVEDPDNAKLYVWDGSQFNYVGDLSGAQGIKGDTGPAPTMAPGKVTASAPGSVPVIKYNKVDGGYVVDYVIPKGEKGDKGDPGERGENWTEDDKQEIIDEVNKHFEDLILNQKY